jgi:hypothetical protein
MRDNNDRPNQLGGQKRSAPSRLGLGARTWPGCKRRRRCASAGWAPGSRSRRRPGRGRLVPPARRPHVRRPVHRRGAAAFGGRRAHGAGRWRCRDRGVAHRQDRPHPGGTTAVASMVGRWADYLDVAVASETRIASVLTRSARQRARPQRGPRQSPVCRPERAGRDCPGDYGGRVKRGLDTDRTRRRASDR